jgi:hypothetical protein
VYLRHLREPGGILAFHVSNRTLDLPLVVRAVAESLGLRSALIRSEAKDDLAAPSVGPSLAPSKLAPFGSSPVVPSPTVSSLVAPSTWVLVARDAEVLESPAILERALELGPADPACLWTDQRASLLRAMRW